MASKRLSTGELKNLSYCLFIFMSSSLCANAQQSDTIKTKSNLKIAEDSIRKKSAKTPMLTHVTGQITDAISGQPLSFISVRFIGSEYGTSSDKEGKFALSVTDSLTRIIFSCIGYQSYTKKITAGQSNELQIRLHTTETELKEIDIISDMHKQYRNKGNPAVALIQQIIDHKELNRMKNADYLQYDQYERIGLSFFDLPSKLIKSRFFTKYKFMLDSTHIIDGQTKTAFPVYLSEKIFKNFFRKQPSKSIQVLIAQKQVNLIKFIDTTGVDIYLNRLYGNHVDIYSNNIFIINNQFLSPIADHAPEFYKFFILDTLKSDKKKLVEISFIPRNKGDLLFEGKLTVNLDGHYAVESCELNINKQININFMRNLQIRLDFEQFHTGGYYLSKSDVKGDFGLLKKSGIGVFGQRTVFYSNYKANTPLDAAFYHGESIQTNKNANEADSSFWKKHRIDTFSTVQAKTYAHMNKLQSMTLYKVTSWLANTFVGDYADLGPVQIGQLTDFFSFDNVEGSRFQVGGRTTPKFNKTFYIDEYMGYGTKDKKLKYNFSAYLSLNQTPFYRYPNDYFRVSYQYDISIPGQDFSINTGQPPLSSFQSGTSDYFIYSKIFKVDYLKEFANHFSLNIALKSWNQQASGTLVYRLNDRSHTLVNNLSTSEIDLGLRYAPHEQIIQSTTDRTTIYSKYPIINLYMKQGIKGVFNGSYSYTNITATIAKRFYLSQLGYADITLLGNVLIGHVPFPLLNISPANQSVAYDPDAYNKMYYLEFVSDHYAGINLTQSFNGFFLNKVPLIKHLKWREYLSFKALYAGLRKENNPSYSKNLYELPTGLL